ncbi:DUF2059 domain-containing protein [uncultured Litoreibacter sp.]|uniref:DUF2059 domain-containing protein n=1 Tax=uncultured Litoreibacter sp. TaxID=1392394 RepID=UPI00263531D2|nr:DUF2059 domain-containing protein [uncultured Litoreibacter sp.]
MKFVTPFVAALLLTAPSFADEATDAATTFIQSPVQQKLLDDMLSPEMVMTQMQAVAGQLPADKVDVLVKIVTEELDGIRPQMEAAMIAGAAQAFTIEEITALTEFYNSPLGTSAMGKMTPYMQQTMGSLGPAMQQMQGNIVQRVQTELQ